MQRTGRSGGEAVHPLIVLVRVPLVWSLTRGFQRGGADSLDAGQEALVYRVAQEAQRNVTAYANARPRSDPG